MEYFILLLGHLLGDFTFQTRWMAKNKSKFDTEGWISCFVHCLVYTLVIVLVFLLFNIKLNLNIIILIFLSHFIPDKFSDLTVRYVKWIRKFNQQPNPNEFSNLKEYETYKIIQLCIVTIVYVVVDNVIHLLLMSLILFKYLN